MHVHLLYDDVIGIIVLYFCPALVHCPPLDKAFDSHCTVHLHTP